MKLQKLPCVVFRVISQLLDPTSLICLSFCSKNMKEKVKMNKYTVVNRYFTLDSTKIMQMFCLKFVNSSIPFYLSFGDPKKCIVRKFNRFNHTINGITYNFRIGLESMYVGKMSDVAVMFNLIEYTLNLFRTSLEGIRIESKFLSSIQQLATHPSVQTVRFVFVDGESLAASKLFELFNNLNSPLLKAYVFAPVQGEVDLVPSLFGAEQVFIKISRWVRKEHLLGSNSRFILLRESNLKEDVLISFVKQWLNGTDTRLETMLVYFPAVNKIDQERIRASLDGHPWNPEKRSQKFLVEASWSKEIVNGARALWSDCEEGLDFERNDGLLGTVIVSEQGRGFFFHVWHKRFH
ncbi:hypothetical protein CAEBREN_14084 [Caenorhabditis brenneri]|uniref:Uncharacterized protein n=1 Tax=Caenorhabditis brenneri TaxID=135651 RepID=G0P7Q7_CAEBE|nr:hypothetical protein CAEBREN_14084 [Caenorhabditis brenneri]